MSEDELFLDFPEISEVWSDLKYKFRGYLPWMYGLYGEVTLFSLNFHPLLDNTDELENHFTRFKTIVIPQSQFLFHDVIIKQGNLKLPSK